MIAIRVTVIHYDKDTNTCEATLQNDDIIEFDPFVSCAIDMTDEEYESGRGYDIVGKTYLLTEYTVYKHNVVPHAGGMIEIL